MKSIINLYCAFAAIALALTFDLPVLASAIAIYVSTPYVLLVPRYWQINKLDNFEKLCLLIFVFSYFYIVWSFFFQLLFVFSIS